MCGIAGIVNLDSREPVGEGELRQMLALIRHRGPDEFGIYLDGPVGLGSARLSIIDLSSGQQPIPNGDGSLWIVFNGEIFNYLELRSELAARGHRFRTTSDTEVLLHAYEEYGPECLHRLNGQFAFAVWNTRDQSLFLARDRLGVRPLFYTQKGGRFVFGSEMKAVLAAGTVRAEIEPAVLEQVFTFWSPISPRTIFRDIIELPPGHYLLARAGKLTVKGYWEPAFPASNGAANGGDQQSLEEYEEQFRDLLVDAAKIRLRADVPVGAYLSGGLDSSIIASIVRNFTSNRLDTFSIAFDDGNFDESAWQRRMAQFLGTEHQVVRATHADIGRVFPEVIWHTETPTTRTAPAPMFMLSKLVRDSGYKVVLTGEGADEFLGGYDIFKEAKIRRFWAEQPESAWRPLLLQRLYPDIARLAKSNPALLTAFFREGLTETESPEYSHALRWRNGRRNCRFLSEDVRQQAEGQGSRVIEGLLPPEFRKWAPLARAQFLEIKIFLSQYLLSSQGDRMGMAHSIEGRFPFLDCRLVEFCNRLPPRLKLRALTEKYLLKRLGRKWLPPEIWQRPKRPYRAPIHRSFFNEATPDYVTELLSPEKLRQTGLFNVTAVGHLVHKIQQGLPIGETDDMALAGILSTQLVHHQFVERFRMPPPLSANDRVKVRAGSEMSGELAPA
jgi:asparagine synthase (glutamine-hydrolysing)